MSTKYVYGDDLVWHTDEPGAKGIRIRWRNPDGTLGDTARADIDAARQYAKDKLAELTEGVYDADVHAGCTVRDAAEMFLDPDYNGLNYAASTLQNKTNHFNKYVLPQLGNTPLDELDVIAINRCLSTYEGKESGERQLLFSIRAFVKWAATNGYPVSVEKCLTKQRLKKLAGSRRKVEPGDIPTEQAVNLLADTVGRVPTRAARNGRPWRALAVRLAAYAGHRPAELMAVTADKIDFDGGRILIDEQYSKHERKLTPPKYGSVRWTILPPNLEDAIAERCARVGNGPLFPLETNPAGHQTSDQFGKSYFNPAALATPAWDPDWTMHSLRHHFATYAINVLNAPIVDVSKMMGHSKPSVTMDMYVGQSQNAFANLRAAMSEAQS